MKPSLDRANAARLTAALNKPYRFPAGIMSLGCYLDTQRDSIIGKEMWTQTHASKRVHYEYKELAVPLTHYGINFTDGCIEVPKLVYDYVTVPDKPAAQPTQFKPDPSDTWPQCATCPVKIECAADAGWDEKWCDAHCPGGDDDEILTIHSVGCA